VFLTHGQLRVLAAEAGSWQAFVLLLGYTGLRWGEATALCVCDIDLARRRIDVRRAFSDVGGHVVLGTPKSHLSRTVPIPRFLARELSAATSGKQADDLVFTMPRGGVLRLSNWRRAIFLPARARAGLSGRFRIHDLRHTAASQFPGRVPTEDAPGDHGAREHHHDS
jgi:integrase